MGLSTAERISVIVHCPHCGAEVDKALAWLMAFDRFACGECGNAILPRDGDNGIRFKELVEASQRIDAALARKP